MAINREEYPHKVQVGLKANTNYKKFFYRFKINGKTYYETFDYSDKSWDKRTRISQAIMASIEFKQKKINPVTELDEDIKLDDFIKLHFENLTDSTWKTTKLKHYTNYLQNHLGQKKVINIKQMDIKKCIKEQELIGLAPRTVKTTLELLNPVFKEAIVNRLIDFNPCTGIVIKLPKTKKVVNHAGEELIKIYNTINEIFKDEPFYLSLYLFAIQGRRKSEILKLKWENIDFKNNTYLIEDTKNNEHQMFILPPFIKSELLKFEESLGWVYKSPTNITQHIGNIEKQTNKIKKRLPNFTLHRLRNVIVSAMAEQGVSATLMSGALGHNNTNTLSKYLSLNYLKGSAVANEMIDTIVKDKED